MRGQVPNENSEGPSTALLKPATHGVALPGPLVLWKKEERRYLYSVLAIPLKSLKGSCPASLHLSHTKDKEAIFISSYAFGSGSTGFHQ